MLRGMRGGRWVVSRMYCVFDLFVACVRDQPAAASSTQSRLHCVAIRQMDVLRRRAEEEGIATPPVLDRVPIRCKVLITAGIVFIQSTSCKPFKQTQSTTCTT